MAFSANGRSRCLSEKHGVWDLKKNDFCRAIDIKS